MNAERVFRRRTALLNRVEKDSDFIGIRGEMRRLVHRPEIDPREPIE